MFDIKRISYFVWFFCCLLVVGCRPSDALSDRYVVVLSMDGFRSDYPLRAHTPTLDSLGKAGVQAAFRPCYPSVTFPNHYSMATGLHPDHHGIVNNSFYDAELDSVYTMRCADPRFFGGEPIWNTAERQGVRTASFYWVGSEIALGGFGYRLAATARGDTPTFDYVVFGRARPYGACLFAGFIGYASDGRTGG